MPTRLASATPYMTTFPGNLHRFQYTSNLLKDSSFFLCRDEVDNTVADDIVDGGVWKWDRSDWTSMEVVFDRPDGLHYEKYLQRGFQSISTSVFIYQLHKCCRGFIVNAKRIPASQGVLRPQSQPEHFQL